jgi:hypothetical protein
MIVGTYGIVAGTNYLSGRLVDVESGQSEASAREKGFSGADADTAAERLVEKLLGVAAR